MKVLVTQPFLNPCNLRNCGPPGSFFHGILQAAGVGSFPSSEDLPDAGIKPLSPAL